MWRQLFPSPLPHVIPTKMYRKNSPRLRFPTYSPLNVDMEKFLVRRRCHSAMWEPCCGLRPGRYRNYICARRMS